MLDVLYEDNHLLIVNKPAGMLVQPDHRGDADLATLAERWLIARYRKPGRAYAVPVHRLDRPVSGLVVIARTSKAGARLARAFRERMITKRYLAVVCGIVVPDQGQLSHHLATEYDHTRGAQAWIVTADTPSARACELSYVVRDRARQQSLLELQPVTGRRHQLRVQCAAAGWPIVGDTKYGAPASLPGRRIALHAWQLVFEHPVQRCELAIEAPLPPDWPWPAARA